MKPKVKSNIYIYCQNRNTQWKIEYLFIFTSDLFQTRVQPSKMFDVLKEDFDHWLIASVVTAMLLASFVTQKLASRKALNRQWK